MATTKFKGIEVLMSGNLPNIGQIAPHFLATNTDLTTFKLEEWLGKKNIILNIFPSIDTSVCATSVRKFNALAASLSDTLVICISKDLPFAHKRFCGAEGIDGVITLSVYKDDIFANVYGVKLINSPLEGLLARAVVVIDKNGIVQHSQLVHEITEEPDYSSAINLLEKISK